MNANVAKAETAPAVAIVGPTASGKTDVAMALAEALQGEIIACDSVQIYRGFEIGSAKPTAEERRRVPHHLVDVANWNDDFDAQRYVALARAAMADIRARGRRPILCGGTGLYLRALRYGLAEVSKADPALRAQLLAEEQAHPGALYARLQQVDPLGAQRTEPNNIVHIVRALEITLLMGEPASVVRTRHGFRAEVTPMQVMGLVWPSELLKQRIITRVERMLRAGLLAEVTRLLGQGVSADCRPMRSVGYREAVEVVQGKAAGAGLAPRIVHSTWSYARRQRTWLRRERDVVFWDTESVGSVIESIRKFLLF